MTFQEFRKGKKRDSLGFAKIVECCDLARSRSFQWVWIDTCCIDKNSSAELSEAINSMCHWYEGAGECYAYLSDIAWDSRDKEVPKSAFRHSLWFTRGWTLQELLAPAEVIFYDREWNLFGTKGTLSEAISAATGIERYLLGTHHYWQSACIAAKMSWLLGRVTSRVEDMAYCMLGLFDVKMPLLYGEGPKAFLRLQLEIIKKSDDESIFAWTSTQPSSGMLASSPRFFAESGDVWTSGLREKDRLPYLMTNKGLEFRVPYRRPGFGAGEDNNISGKYTSIALNCLRPGKAIAITIHLYQTTIGWQRVCCDELDLSESVEESIDVKGPKSTAVIYIPQEGL